MATINCNTTYDIRFPFIYFKKRVAIYNLKIFYLKSIYCIDISNNFLTCFCNCMGLRERYTLT